MPSCRSSRKMHGAFEVVSRRPEVNRKRQLAFRIGIRPRTKSIPSLAQLGRLAVCFREYACYNAGESWAYADTRLNFVGVFGQSNWLLLRSGMLMLAPLPGLKQLQRGVVSPGSSTLGACNATSPIVPEVCISTDDGSCATLNGRAWSLIASRLMWHFTLSDES
jgi:hypothetical protein